MKKFQKSALFGLAFLEGGVVMVCELSGAKMMAPVFGTSLYVWAAVLGITLGALATGYFLGGEVSKKFPRTPRPLLALLIGGSILVILMPWLAEKIFLITRSLDIRLGASLSLLFYLFPPLLLLGMSSPVLIGLISTAADDSGKSAGTVYAISTCGGIAATFLTGFVLLPEVGIKATLTGSGLLLFIPAFCLSFITDKGRAGTAAILFIVALVVALWPASRQDKNFKSLYLKEGIFGQVKVVEFNLSGAGEADTRALLVNNSGQTMVSLKNADTSIWSYTDFIATLASQQKDVQDALLIGLGGGTLLRSLDSIAEKVTVVEIDKRVKEAAIGWFGLNPAREIIIDDGRHFMNDTGKKYDLIVFDAFLGETPPHHLYTIESFRKTRELLNENGSILINFYGFFEGDKGNAAKALFKTMREIFPETMVLATDMEESELSRNLVFVGGGIGRAIRNEETGKLLSHQLIPTHAELQVLPVYTDDLPVMEKLYLSPALAWRKAAIAYYVNRN